MRILITVIILMAMHSCAPPPQSGKTRDDNTPISSEPDASASDATSSTSQQNTTNEEGWESLFDGQSISGWHGYMNKRDPSRWKIEDGTLFLDVDADTNRTSIDLVTDEEYENFHLKLDWKISKNGNSGIMFGVKESPEFESDYFTGPEMQILDNEGHADAKITKHRAGDLYDLISASPQTAKPAGEWNTAEIIKNNNTLEFRLNGPTVVKTTLWDDNWNKMVAGSKFNEWKSFGTFKSGRIALQDHGDKVWFRNIKIKKL